MSAVYSDVLKHRVPEIHYRRALAEAQKLVTETKTPYGPLHQSLEIPKAAGGRPYRLLVNHPLAMLWYCLWKDTSSCNPASTSPGA